MTTITLYLKDRKYCGFKSQGHAGSEDDDFSSIVCAGISALTQTAVLSILDIAEVSEVDLDVLQEDGYLHLYLLRNEDIQKTQTQTIFRMLERGLQEMTKLHGEYLNLIKQEVQDDLI